jgi:hypothetical protein
MQYLKVRMLRSCQQHLFQILGTKHPGSVAGKWTIILMTVASTLFSGCAHPNAGHKDLWDAMFGRRHNDVIHSGKHDPLLAFAHEVTVIEDDLRRDGTITIKKPDVWGDANLVHFIQEYDREMAGTVGKFEANLQAYLARSDQAELSATQSLAQGLGGTAPPSVTASAIDIKDIEPFSLIAKSLSQAPAAAKGLSIEPTESERQHSTYVLVNQALRRRNMGDDNSRAAGYGLYKFRIPVSVLPGRETNQNHAGLVTLRAQLQVDEAHLRYTFPKLVIADIVDTLAEPILTDWNKKTDPLDDMATAAIARINRLRALTETIQNSPMLAPEDPASVTPLQALQTTLSNSFASDAVDPALEAFRSTRSPAGFLASVEASREFAKATSPPPDQQAWFKEVDLNLSQLHAILAGMEALRKEQIQLSSPALTPKAIVPPITPSTKAWGDASILALRRASQDHFSRQYGEKGRPKVQELRAFLFDYLANVYRTMEERREFTSYGDIIASAAIVFERGFAMRTQEADWLRATKDVDNLDEHFHAVSWIVALQAGTLDRNLKRILKEMAQSGKIGNNDVSQAEAVRFFDPDYALPATLELWTAIIQQEFPLTVFTLDPQIEEQNVFDAFSRRREMQVALAYGVASGQLNANRAIKFSRQLALDMETIALNRTVVGFSHSHDTFGWYFYPRVQTPPTESTNIGAFARTVWSTGPTEHYDVKHRNLEPGIRECEVIVAMPSFVTKVSFDVTSNWEKLTCPGKTKRSYEEMVAQGGRLHRLRSCLNGVEDNGCYRPGDYARLISRVDQLEHMLGMQTHVVNVPYQYEQSGTDLFDKGKVQLVPVLQDFYGLSYVAAGTDINARFFIRGKNFHPTLTHVVVGGTESHSEGNAPKVEVISRELILVHTEKLTAALSPDTPFEVRVGTPAGLSNPLWIDAKPVKPQAVPVTPPSNFDWQAKPLKFEAQLSYMPLDDQRVTFKIEEGGIALGFRRQTPLPPGAAIGTMVFLVTALDAEGKPIFENVATSSIGELALDNPVPLAGIGDKIQELLRLSNVTTSRIPTSIKVRTFLRFDSWPYEEFGTPIEIKVHQLKQ